MQKIIVETGRLDDTANRIEESNNEYERIYNSLYSLVDKMSSAWQGKDNVAFSNKIKAYEEDFKQISIVLRQYAEFLRNSARAYQETQDELCNSANRL